MTSGIQFLALVFAFWVRLMWSFLRSQRLGSLEEVFAHGDGFPLAVNIRWLRSRGWLVRRRRYCLVKNQGGCQFGLFNYSYVAFRAVGLYGVFELLSLCVMMRWFTCSRGHSALSLLLLGDH